MVQKPLKVRWLDSDGVPDSLAGKITRFDRQNLAGHVWRDWSRANFTSMNGVRQARHGSELTGFGDYLSKFFVVVILGLGMPVDLLDVLQLGFEPAAVGVHTQA